MVSKKVLVAEDDLTTRKILSKTLESHGFVPVLTSNGKRAWELLEDNVDFALLITDIQMPEMGGRELIQAARNDARLKELPIVILSGVVGPNQIADLLKLGASRFLPKPVDIAMLQDYIGVLLK